MFYTGIKKKFGTFQLMRDFGTNSNLNKFKFKQFRRHAWTGPFLQVCNLYL